MTSVTAPAPTHRGLHAALLILGAGLLSAVVFLVPERGKLAGTGDSGDVLAPVKVEGQAPAFSLPAPDGESVALEGLRGKYVLLNFWATWCKPCKEELPHLARLARGLEDKPVEIVLISVDETWEKVQTLAGELQRFHADQANAGLVQDTIRMLRGSLHNVTSLLDAPGQVPGRYGTEKYPETYLIDPAGKLQWKFVGPKPWGHASVVSALRARVSPPGK